MSDPQWRACAVAGAVLLTMALSGAGAVAPAAPDEPRAPVQLKVPKREALDGLLAAWIARTGAPGITAACAIDDATVISGAAGLARLKLATPMTPDSRMLSGSTGKTYCAAVMLLLVEEGRARLDEPISAWLGEEPWFDRLPNARAITLQMLLNHTSGVPEHVQLQAFTEAIAAAPQRTWRPDELVAFVLDKPPACEPGGGWSYADTNYILVGMIIEKLTGRTFYDEARDRILVPFGLEATTPSDSPRLDGLVSGYTGPGNPFPVPEEAAADGVYALNPQFEWTGGGYISNSADLARWARLLWSGKVLQPGTMDEVRRGVKAKTGPDDEYGLGVQMWPSRYGPVMAHTGWFPGYITLMAYYPQAGPGGIGIALQINTDVPAKIRGHRALADALVESCLEQGGPVEPTSAGSTRR